MQQIASLNVECLAEMVLRRLKKKKRKRDVSSVYL